MQPTIQGTEFGSITVDGEVYDHDLVIRLSGKVKKRKKKLSKREYGTSHTVSLAEAEHIYDDNAEQLIVGTGQYGNVKLSDGADGYFKGKHCVVNLMPTPEAVKAWNEAKGRTIGMFHVTCRAARGFERPPDARPERRNAGSSTHGGSCLHADPQQRSARHRH